jgi:hypothetical protein
MGNFQPKFYYSLNPHFNMLRMTISEKHMLKTKNAAPPEL